MRGSRTIGSRLSDVNAVVAAVRTDRPDLTLRDAAAFLDVVHRGASRDEVLFGVFLLARFAKEFDATLWPRVDRWIDGLDNWETCDQLAMNVGGEIVARNPRRVVDLVAWARRPDPWWRRRSSCASR